MLYAGRAAPISMPQDTTIHYGLDKNIRISQGDFLLDVFLSFDKWTPAGICTSHRDLVVAFKFF